jgi:hypothetical protein
LRHEEDIVKNETWYFENSQIVSIKSLKQSLLRYITPNFFHCSPSVHTSGLWFSSTFNTLLLRLGCWFLVFLYLTWYVPCPHYNFTFSSSVLFQHRAFPSFYPNGFFTPSFPVLKDLFIAMLDSYLSRMYLKNSKKACDAIVSNLDGLNMPKQRSYPHCIPEHRTKEEME